jgi:hypothetical protein
LRSTTATLMTLLDLASSVADHAGLPLPTGQAKKGSFHIPFDRPANLPPSYFGPRSCSLLALSCRPRGRIFDARLG